MKNNYFSLFIPSLLCAVYHPSQVSAFQSRTLHSAPKTTMRSSAGDGKDGKDFEVITWNPLRLMVLRLGLTEPAWTSPLNYQKKNGAYGCAYCGQELFGSDSKYDSGSGWPSFWRSIREGAVSYKMEYDGRLECKCGRCSSHLGHVFLDGPKPGDVSEGLMQSSPSTDPRTKRDNARLPRFCVNGASLRVKDASNSS